jgi:glutamate-ammonia-ligase adenylyltransferase
MLIGPEVIGPEDWRGTPVSLADLPALSRYVQRSLQAESQSGAAIAGGAGGSGVEALARLADAAWTAARLLEALQAELAAATGDATQRLASALRRLRRRVLLTLIARDATGRAELAEVVATMTALAELAVQTAVEAQARELAAIHGTPISTNGLPQDLLVVGMGKLGGA